MSGLNSKLYDGGLCGAMALALLAGCGKKDDPVTQAEKKDVAAGVAAPSIAEVKAIAEEGFIYGLPIVMNYAIMYDYAVDRNSGQFKCSNRSLRDWNCAPMSVPHIAPNRRLQGTRRKRRAPENGALDDTIRPPFRRVARPAAGARAQA